MYFSTNLTLGIRTKDLNSIVRSRRRVLVVPIECPRPKTMASTGPQTESSSMEPPLVRSAAKVRSVMEMVNRNFQETRQRKFPVHIQNVFVRPQMEYCVQAWSLHLEKDTKCLERVQRVATKMVHRLRHLPYEQRPLLLGLTTLEERRTRGDRIETYKIMTGRNKEGS